MFPRYHGVASEGAILRQPMVLTSRVTKPRLFFFHTDVPVLLYDYT